MSITSSLKHSMTVLDQQATSKEPCHDQGVACMPNVEAALLLQTSIGLLYLQQRHCDVTVTVKERTFHVHKAVLAAMSPYFDAMFSSGMRETQESVVTLKAIEPEIFEAILNFMYSGTVKITEENAEELLESSAMFQITLLLSKCETFLVGHVSPENCIALWKIARAHACTKLEERAFALLLQNFPHLGKTEDFSRLDKDDVIEIIMNDSLCVQAEEPVCDAVFSWLESDETSREQHVEELVQCLRLPLVSADYLMQEVEPRPILAASKVCQDVVKEAINYHMLPARRPEMSSQRMKFRRYFRYEEVIVVIGGYSQSGEKVADVLCFSFSTKAWYILCPLMYKLGREFACCVFGNDIFVSGGSQRLQGMVRFRSEYNEWQKCSSLLQGRRRHAMCAVGQCLYVLGGYDDKIPEESRRTLADIEEVGIATCACRRVGTLLTAVRSMSAAVEKEKIFVFGGVQSDDNESAAVQCFDTRLQVCTFIDNLPVCCKLTKAVVLEKRVLIFCTDGTTLCMTEDSRFQVYAKIRNFSRRRYGVVVYQGRVLVLGGECGQSILQDVFSFDVKSREMTTLPGIVHPCRANFGSVKIVMNKKFLTTEFQPDI